MKTCLKETISCSVLRVWCLISSSWGFMREMNHVDCEKGKRGPDFLYIFQSSWVNVVLVYHKKSTLDCRSSDPPGLKYVKTSEDKLYQQLKA